MVQVGKWVLLSCLSVFFLVLTALITHHSFAETTVTEITTSKTSSSQIQFEITKVKNYLDSLETKRAVAKSQNNIKRVTYIDELIYGTKRRLDRMETALQEALAAEAKAKVEIVQEPEKPVVVVQEPPAEVPPIQPLIGLEGGMVAQMTGGMAEIEWPLSMPYGEFAVKGSAGYLQGTDPSNVMRKIAPIQAELSYYAPVRPESGIRAYATGGANYIVKAGDSGTGYGGIASLGIEGQVGGGKWYGEVGYGVEKITTPANIPAFKGVNALFGFKAPFGF